MSGHPAPPAGIDGMPQARSQLGRRRQGDERERGMRLFPAVLTSEHGVKWSRGCGATMICINESLTDGWIADDGDEMVKDSGRIRILRYCPGGIFFIYIILAFHSNCLFLMVWYFGTRWMDV